MLDAKKIAHLTQDTVYALSSNDWLMSCWHLATDGIVSGTTSVLRTDNGYWRISCDSLKTASLLHNEGEIIHRLHQLHELRPLPPVRKIIPIPPANPGTLMDMLKTVPYQQMPEHLWRSFAWQNSVDPITANSTEIISFCNGILRIKCHSEHAWIVLQEPQPVLKMLKWFGTLRKLPEITGLVPSLGEIQIKPCETECSQEILDDAAIPEDITDPEMRKLLTRIQNARLKMKK